MWNPFSYPCSATGKTGVFGIVLVVTQSYFTKSDMTFMSFFTTITLFLQHKVAFHFLCSIIAYFEYFVFQMIKIFLLLVFNNIHLLHFIELRLHFLVSFHSSQQGGAIQIVCPPIWFLPLPFLGWHCHDEPLLRLSQCGIIAHYKTDFF